MYESAAQPETQTRELPEFRQESNTRETEESDLRHISFSPLGTSKVRQATTTQPPPAPVLARPSFWSWLVTRSSPAGIPLHCRTGDDDRLLPDSWTKDPLSHRRSLPEGSQLSRSRTQPLPLISATASVESTSPLKRASAYMSTVPTDLAPNITLDCTSLHG